MVSINIHIWNVEFINRTREDYDIGKSIILSSSKIFPIVRRLAADVDVTTNDSIDMMYILRYVKRNYNTIPSTISK